MHDFEFICTTISHLHKLMFHLLLFFRNCGLLVIVHIRVTQYTWRWQLRFEIQINGSYGINVTLVHLWHAADSRSFYYFWSSHLYLTHALAYNVAFVHGTNAACTCIYLQSIFLHSFASILRSNWGLIWIYLLCFFKKEALPKDW